MIRKDSTDEPPRRGSASLLVSDLAGRLTAGAERPLHSEW